MTAAHARGRNRRASDVVLLASAMLVGALAAVVAESVPGTDEAIGDALGTLLGWARPLWRSALFAALLLAVVIASDVIWRRPRRRSGAPGARRGRAGTAAAR